MEELRKAAYNFVLVIPTLLFLAGCGDDSKPPAGATNPDGSVNTDVPVIEGGEEIEFIPGDPTQEGSSKENTGDTAPLEKEQDDSSSGEK